LAGDRICVENRWIGENVDSDGDGLVDRQIRFVYDGNQIVEFEKEGSDPLTGADLSHRYLWQAFYSQTLRGSPPIVCAQRKTRGESGWNRRSRVRP
jgi:hypothetical protein